MPLKSAAAIVAFAWLALTGPAAAAGEQPQNVLSHDSLDELENEIGLIGLLGLIGLFGLRRSDRRRE
jgi:MYXO-CTERM domain-containing protein